MPGWRLAAGYLGHRREQLTQFEAWRLDQVLAATTISPFLSWWLFRTLARVGAVEAEEAGRVWHAWRTGKHLAQANDGWSPSWWTTDSAARLPAGVLLP
jgi:hypothetical protein